MMIDDATIKKFVDAEMAEYYDGAYVDSSCARDQLTRFSRAIEQLARQQQKEEDAHNERHYLLFAGDDKYPNGGAEDLQGEFDTLELAIKSHDPKKYDYSGGWANILRVDNLKIVKHFYNGEWFDPEDYAEIGKGMEG